MRKPIPFALLPLTLALTCVGLRAQTAAAAAESAKPPSSRAPQTQEDGRPVERVVITGTANLAGKKQLQTSFSISSLDEQQLKESAPSSTADLLKTVPGVFVETSGGETGANMAVRGFPTAGDAPYVSMQLNGAPLFPASTLSFLENSSLFRLDDTIERMEVLRGGTSPIWSNGQPGATANFIMKKGSSTPEGSVRYTTGTGSLQRLDLYWGGPLNADWTLSGGGFYRTSHGVRDTQYASDQGGQASLMLTRRLDKGEVSFYGRFTDDKNTFFTGIPLVSKNGGADLSSYPGLDASHGALQGQAIRHVTIETSPGATPGTKTLDLADGRGMHGHVLGMNFNQDWSGWDVSARTNLVKASTPTTALFTGGTPVTLGDYIASKVQAANAAGIGSTPATTGNASYVGGGALTDMNQAVIQAGIWSVEKDVQSFSNDARLSRALNNEHTLTLGLYTALYKSKDRWYLGNSALMTAQSHAQLVDVALDNGVKVTRNGFDGASFYSLDASYKGSNVAMTVADEWKVSSQLTLDGGVRWEHAKVTGSVGQPVSGDLDGNPLTLYNNNASQLSGNYKTLDYSDSQVSYTLGGGYMLNPHLNVFARLNSGFKFPAFDDLRDGNTTVEKIKQFEVGMKASERQYTLFLTAFFNRFSGQPFQQFLVNGTPVNYTLASKAMGLEFEGAWRPMKGLELSLGGNWAQAEYVDSGTFTGNQVQRQPKFQFRFSPSYRWNTSWGDLKTYFTYAHVGQRWGDLSNAQALAGYNTLDAGLVANVNDFEIRLSGTNLTNTIGLTEGNARVIGNGTDSQGVFIGRPIFGRAFQLSAAYRF